jgi:hypothetical protein
VRRLKTSFEQKAQWMRERQDAAPVSELAWPAQPCVERYLTPAQIAETLQLSSDTVIRMFEKEPGVLVVGDADGSRTKRRYRIIRVPESVYQRVLRLRTNP